MSALDDILGDNNKFLFTGVKRLSDKLNEHINDKLFNFIKFGETNDISWLIKEQNKYEEQQENKDPNSTISNSNPIPQATIKLEKLSISSTKTRSSKQLTKSNKQSTRSKKQSIISEESNYMQAPLKLPPRKNKIQTEAVESPQRQTRSTRTKTKIQQNKQTNGKSSDVIIQNSTITMIDITEDTNSENGTSDKAQSDKLPVRSTRTKTRQDKKKQEEAELEKAKIVRLNQKESTITKVIKRELSSNSEDEQENVKRSKSSSNESEKNKTSQEYEDAMNVDIAETNNFVTVNATMVVEKPKMVNNKESEKQKIQEIVSPYEKSTLKKKVEVFEKFGSSSKQPSSASKIPQLYREDHGRGSAVKYFTPLNKFDLKGSSTTKITKKLFTCNKKSFQHNDSALSLKSLSTLKASQAEYREREKLRKEKEEAQLKKEAILQAQAEDKRRKREEKQLKAQQQRDLLIQKEKEKLLELQKQKEERHKQAKSEMEEKLRKSKAEVEKKRLMVKNKAKLVKDSVEREAAGTAGLPIYMTTKAPLLPSVDCYDSDDERYAEHHKKTLTWCSGSALNKQLYAQSVVGEKMKNTLFCSMNENPDLVQIFDRVDSRKLKRTSSAQWKKPPRYTLFSETNDIIFSDDSD